MRTNIEIDDSLIEDAIELSGIPTKRAAVEAALKMFVRVQKQTSVRSLRGKLHWEGDLEESRLERTFE